MIVCAAPQLVTKVHLVFILCHESIIVLDQCHSSFNDVFYDLQLIQDAQSFFEPFMLIPSRRIRFNLELIEERSRRFRYEIIKTSCVRFFRNRTIAIFLLLSKGTALSKNLNFILLCSCTAIQF